VAGVPDELERLWTPHRMAYVTGGEAPPGGYDRPEGCPFCLAPSRSAEDGLVVARGEHVYAVLNRFPYNPGHLLICPYRHVADYPDLDQGETVELATFSQTAMTVIRQISGPAGFNLGMNQGGIAGAGIAAHLHQHIVPRWAGDTNFMPVIGRTKTLPQLLADTRTLLADAWEQSAAARPRRSGRLRPAPVDDAAPRKAPARRATKASTADSAATTRTGTAKRRTG
jgi:ATP adenylyltransferase